MFALGELRITRKASDVLRLSGQDVVFFLEKHVGHDWGELDAEDWRFMDEMAERGGRLMSVYHTLKGAKIYIITEANRSATTILTPEEY